MLSRANIFLAGQFKQKASSAVDWIIGLSFSVPVMEWCSQTVSMVSGWADFSLYHLCILCIVDFGCSPVTCSVQWHVRTRWGSSWACPLTLLSVIQAEHDSHKNDCTSLDPKTYGAQPPAYLQLRAVAVANARSMSTIWPRGQLINISFFLKARMEIVQGKLSHESNLSFSEYFKTSREYL